MENNYCQLKDMTDQEKFEMYMNVPHEKLVRMKIEEEKLVEQLEGRMETLIRQFEYSHLYGTTITIT